MEAEFHPVTLRPATAGDRDALVRIADRDSRPLPPGPHLLAERDGVAVAAISLTTGGLVADPFVRTAEVCDLLRLKARTLGRLRPRRLRPLRPRPAVMPT